MTPEHREALIKAIDASGRRMKRDKKFMIARMVKLGIMTPKGNLTRRWKEIKKWYLENTVPIPRGQA